MMGKEYLSHLSRFTLHSRTWNQTKVMYLQRQYSTKSNHIIITRMKGKGGKIDGGPRVEQKGLKRARMVYLLHHLTHYDHQGNMIEV